MSVLMKKSSTLRAGHLIRSQVAFCSSKKWPDDKWVIMNGLRRFGNWWQKQLIDLDNFCCRLNDVYPNMPPLPNPESKFETISNNLQLQAIKYWASRGLCMARSRIVAIQQMEWHVNTHNFIMSSIRSSISTTKSFLEKHLLDEVPPSTSDQTNCSGQEVTGIISKNNRERCLEATKSDYVQKRN